MFSPIELEAPIYRPPSEARSFLLPVTLGCSHNRCTYCNMYRDKPYRVRSLDAINTDIRKAHAAFQNVGYSPEKVFLCDGDALGAPFDLLLSTLKTLRSTFPQLRHIGIYATAANMLAKGTDELERLAQAGLKLVYLGLESGNDAVLHQVAKGNTRADMIAATTKASAAQLQLSVIAMLGLGGSQRSAEHTRDTASIISSIAPRYFSFLTTVAIPGTPYQKMVSKGRITPLSSRQLLGEMRAIIAAIDPPRTIIFRANHVSNQLPLAGTLPKDTPVLLQQIDQWMQDTPHDHYPAQDHQSL